jgi:hypothetical protein
MIRDVSLGSGVPDSFHHGSRSRIPGSKKHWIPNPQHCLGLKWDVQDCLLRSEIMYITLYVFTPSVPYFGQLLEPGSQLFLV